MKLEESSLSTLVAKILRASGKFSCSGDAVRCRAQTWLATSKLLRSGSGAP